MMVKKPFIKVYFLKKGFGAPVGPLDSHEQYPKHLQNDTTRWAAISYRWGYTPYKWPKINDGFHLAEITLLIEVISRHL